MATNRHIHGVRADTVQAVIDHNRVRVAFLSQVTRDPRVEQFFAVCAQTYGIEKLLALLTPVLARAATLAGFDSPAAFLRRRGETLDDLQARFDAIPDDQDRAFLMDVLARVEIVLRNSRHDRWLEAQGFVIAVLFGTTIDEDVPIRAWLADDLVTTFDAIVVNRLYGTSQRLVATRPEQLPPNFPSGRRGKKSGPSLEDYARWYYRFYVAEPRSTVTALAAERVTAIGEPTLEPKDRRGIKDRPDTKAIRYGIATAKRLLELPVPPEHWTAYFDEILPNRGGKIS